MRTYGAYQQSTQRFKVYAAAAVAGLAKLGTDPAAVETAVLDGAPNAGILLTDAKPLVKLAALDANGAPNEGNDKPLLADAEAEPLVTEAVVTPAEELAFRNVKLVAVDNELPNVTPVDATDVVELELVVLAPNPVAGAATLVFEAADTPNKLLAPKAGAELVVLVPNPLVGAVTLIFEPEDAPNILLVPNVELELVVVSPNPVAGAATLVFEAEDTPNKVLAPKAGLKVVALEDAPNRPPAPNAGAELAIHQTAMTWQEPKTRRRSRRQTWKRRMKARRIWKTEPRRLVKHRMMERMMK
nr:hypothetical protein [Tanacetum cinerariifolium]